MEKIHTGQERLAIEKKGFPRSGIRGGGTISEHENAN